MRPLSRSSAAWLVAACLAAPAVAAVPWAAPGGPSTNLTYTDGQTAAGHYAGTGPGVANDTFLFKPTAFSLSESDGVPYDALMFTVTAKPGRTLTRVQARVSGDSSTLDGTPPAGPTGLAALGGPSASATATLTLTNPATSAMITRAFNFGAQFAAEDGSFTASVVAALPGGWHGALVSLSTNLTATAGPGSTAFVQVKGATVDFDTVQTVPVVPLPPAVLAAIPGVVVAYLARRRARRA